MSQTITARFDGFAIIPDQKVNLPPGPVRIQIEPMGEPYPLTQIRELATDMGVDDLAENHRQHALPIQPSL